jgi:hypothetical protein
VTVITRHHISKAAKFTILAAFLLAVPLAAYYTYATIMLSNKVKIRVISADGAKPIKNQKIVFRSTECEPKPCQGRVLAEVKTSIFGNATLTTKELGDSFVVEANGYKVTDEYLRSPGSLQFSRQNDTNFYSVDISQGDLRIELRRN